MAVTETEPTSLGGNTYLLNYTSDLGGTPTFRIWMDGIKIAETTETSFQVYVEGDSPYFEVRDDANNPSLFSVSSVGNLWWLSVSGTEFYAVEEYVASVWTEKARVYHGTASAYAWNTRPLEDETTHQFRIIATGSDGNTTTAASWSGLMVRRPDVPTLTWVYNGSTPKTLTATVV